MATNDRLVKEKVRIDKWLWSVRIFKSRTLATDECKSGKVKINGVSVKPSTLLSVGDTVEVKKNGFTFAYKVLLLLESRVGAPIAQTCYADLTPQDELNKYKDWFVGKGKGELREKGAGRPTKKERREIDKYKTDQF